MPVSWTSPLRVCASSRPIGEDLVVATSPIRCTPKKLCPRIERVTDRLFEGEEPVLHLMG
jgi:hypothetical protein